jgi:hypothetical protein
MTSMYPGRLRGREGCQSLVASSASFARMVSIELNQPIAGQPPSEFACCFSRDYKPILAYNIVLRSLLLYSDKIKSTGQVKRIKLWYVQTSLSLKT